jgi:hypothetical protein
MMDLLTLPIGSIIIFAAIPPAPPAPDGWLDITDSFECIQQIEEFREHFPTAGEFVSHDPLFCIKKIEPTGVS